MTKIKTQHAAYCMRSSQRIAREASESFVKKEYDRVVRKAQESVEMYLKASLLEEGIDPVKTHDLAMLADNLQQKIPVKTEDLDFLTQERIPSFYGAADFIPDEAYDAEDGNRCLKILRSMRLLK
jgi:HEPN domain-containing protein